MPFMAWQHVMSDLIGQRNSLRYRALRAQSSSQLMDFGSSSRAKNSLAASTAAEKARHEHC
jgi:hypothetical protein